MDKQLPDRYYSAAEVADLLKLKKGTVYEMIRRGEIPSVKLGKQFRIASGVLEKLLGAAMPAASGTATADTAGNPLDSMGAARDTPAVFTNSPRRGGTASVRSDSALFSRTEGGFIVCGQDPSLDIITSELSADPYMPPILRSYAGSYNGLYQLYRGGADVCTTHLWDERTQSYNLPYLEHLLPGMAVMMVRLFGRMTGFYVAAGNPKGIYSWEDLHRKELTLVNREAGSGTRVLLDAKLRTLGINPSKLNGYGNIKTSFLSVAASVAAGEADVGLGMAAAMRQNSGIDFIPLQKEWLDMVFPANPMNTLPYELLLDYISSERFIMAVRTLGDYDFAETGRIFKK